MFYDREDAGEQLGRLLSSQKVRVDVILGLPRGGVVTAAGVAKVLKKPLDVLVVRKIGIPGHSEFAVGAMAEGGIKIYSDATLEMMGINPKDLAQVEKIEKLRLQSYIKKFHKAPLDLKNKTVMLVDDGIATGLTVRAAVLSCRKYGAKKIIVAAPVASQTAADDIDKIADKTYFLKVDPAFAAVGQYYQHFDQTTDEEVVSLIDQ